MGHTSYSWLEKLVKKNLVDGLDKDLKFSKIDFCEACVNAKMTKLPFKTREKPEAHDVSKYLVTFINDSSNFTAVYLKESQKYLSVSKAIQNTLMLNLIVKFINLDVIVVGSIFQMNSWIIVGERELF